MFPNTTPNISAPVAPAQMTTPYTDPTTQGLTNPTASMAAAYQLPGLSMSQMMQTSPYSEYQKSMQAMQQQQKNMTQNGVGVMAQPPQPGAPPGAQMNNAGGASNGGIFGPFGKPQ